MTEETKKIVIYVILIICLYFVNKKNFINKI